MKIIKTFGHYLKHHRKSLTLFILFILIFISTFSLYNLPIETIVYSFILCFSVGFVFVAYDFFRYYNRHKLFNELKESITLSLNELPIPNNLVEKDYKSLLDVVFNEKNRIISENDKVKSDMVDYYTLWVHQIKTPIAGMQLLLQSNDTEENKELLSELFKVEQYVEMVLSYLRLNSAFTDFVIKEYSLDNIVKQAVRKYAPMFIRKKINLDFKELNCTVLTDEKWLLFVIEQILSNALKYSSKGTISIYITDDKTLVIKDMGIGISQENLPLLFNKGFTGYNGRTDKKATGLGLYLCKLVLSKLSHTIKIESEVAVGTSVFINLDTIDLIPE